MSLGLIGKKIGMTRFFDQEAGNAIPVTVIDVSGSSDDNVVGHKTVKRP